MYRAPRVVNRIIDRQVRLDKDRKHFEALRDQKPTIDTTQPPPNRRLMLFEKRQARYRQNLQYEEALKYQELAEIQRLREKTPKRPKTDFQTFLSSLKQSSYSQSSMSRADSKLCHTKQDNVYEDSQEIKPEEVVDDNGMTVVDKRPQANYNINTIKPMLQNSTFQTTPSANAPNLYPQ